MVTVGVSVDNERKKKETKPQTRFSATQWPVALYYGLNGSMETVMN